MIVISHRGYENGEDEMLENNPEQIKKLLKMNIDVEIDVRYNEGFYLGHDCARYEVDIGFLKQDGLWCHAKDIKSFELMLVSGIHCFWHQSDDYTLTSRGVIWAYPNVKLHNLTNSVCLLPEKFEKTYENFYAICTDYPFKYLKGD